jgi:peptide/nickel transport system substrate-binding protein
MDRLPDGLVFDFVLRKGVRFHNGDRVTADDVKFSFERYRRVAHKTLKERVAAIETPDATRVRIRLKQPWLIPGYIFSASYEDVKLKGR